MSLPEASSSADKVVVQNIAQENLDGATVMNVQVPETTENACQLLMNETNPDTFKTAKNSVTNNSNELDEHSKQVDSNIISVANSVNVVELEVNQSPAMKNRRKKNKKKESDNVRKDSTEVPNGQSTKTDPDSDEAFSVQRLNQVFSVFGITKPKDEEKGEDAADTTSGTKYKQVDDNCKQGGNTAGTSEQTFQVSNVNVQQIQRVSECDTSVQIKQRLESECPSGSGKSKSAEKRRKMRNLEQRNENAEVVSQEQKDNAVVSKLRNRVSGSMGQAGCSVQACGRSEAAKIKGKKKLSVEKGHNVQSNDRCSQDFAKSLEELYQLLQIKSPNNLPGSSQHPNLNQNLLRELDNLKSQIKITQEQAKTDKGVKKKNKKLEVATENQSNLKKKKEKSKIKKGTTTSTAERGAGDHTEDSTPTQKSPEKKQKKKSKQFEEYWSLEAVKEGIQNGTVIEGPIRINLKRYTEAYVSSPTGGQDILIEGITDRNRALEGDLVAVQLKDPSEWKIKNQGQEKRNGESNADTSELYEEEETEVLADLSVVEFDSSQKPQVTGKVVCILSMQHSRKCVGYLKLMKNPNEKNALFSPRDARIPRMQIPQYKCPKDFWLDPASKEKTLYMGKMVKWTAGSFALGEIVKELGQTADVHVETEAILLDNDLDVTPYPEEIYNQKECIFTIDPRTAKDLDDAVSCKELENGNLEIGVHISDVTFFLEEDSVLDIEVSKRATSVYLVDTVHHMLPVELCLMCSLLPGEDKLAYSIIWEFSKSDAKIISQRIVRSVIHSCVKFAYEHAQAMLDNPENEWDPNEFPTIGNGFSLSDICKTVNNLQTIAKKLRNQRFEDGALRIDQTKLFMELDQSGMPMAVHEYINEESHRLIEEFMLLANMCTAKFIYDNYPDIAFLRSHPEPHQWPLEQLQNAMASRGIHLNITSAGALQASLTKYSGSDFLSRTRHAVLNSLCAKTMTRAKYFCSCGVKEEEFWHYALSVPFYTHFTSPIRRYADVMVHRLLNAALNYCSKPSWSENHVSGIAANCNKKKYTAKLAGEQSIKLYLAIYIRNQPTVIEDAVVIDVKDYSFDVIVIKFGLTLRVYISKLSVDLANDPSKKSSPMKIVWHPDDENALTTFQVVDVFTIVKVLIRCDDSLKLEAVLIRPENPDRLPSELSKT
ncbi:Uncharacterized protein GBIM_11798 [Gryllus bimaculatus]|nr:Uncharacterized protein GBIM_11798 [Gryllus bimaculatus]